MPEFKIDAAAIRELAALVVETGLSEIEYQDGQRRVRVARQIAVETVQAVEPRPAPAGPVAAADGAGERPPDAGHPGAVTAPMVGTVYLQSEPTAPQFVRAGDRVEKGDTLLIIEAMKVMNQIPAPRSGVVRRILVENGAPVEYGEVLMVLE